MSACCGHNHDVSFDGTDAKYRRILWLVIGLNAGMFVVEMVSGHLARSQALQADALDFLADSLTYGLSLAVIGRALKTRSRVALLKGASLALMALWVLGGTLYRVFVLGTPEAPVMGVVGFMALAANVGSVLLLLPYKNGDANVRSVWLCSRNDAIGNVAVMLAAALVWWTGTKWPDLAVAGFMALLFGNSARQILAHAWAEYRHGDDAHGHGPAHADDACGCGHRH